MLNCDIVVSEFKPKSQYYIHFQTNTLGEDMNIFISWAMGRIAPLLSFNKDDFGTE